MKNNDILRIYINDSQIDNYVRISNKNTVMWFIIPFAKLIESNLVKYFCKLFSKESKYYNIIHMSELRIGFSVSANASRVMSLFNNNKKFN